MASGRSINVGAHGLNGWLSWPDCSMFPVEDQRIQAHNASCRLEPGPRRPSAQKRWILIDGA